MSRPNVLFILSDDTDPDYLGCYGGPYLTPNLDALRADGIQMMQAHVATPICCPSRYNYFTGRYACRGIPGKTEEDAEGRITDVGFNAVISPGEDHLAPLLQRNGYVTGFTGKCHMGRPKREIGAASLPADGDPRNPEVEAVMRANQQCYLEELRRIGFDYAASVTWGNIDDGVPRAAWIHNQEWITAGALDFLRQHGKGEKPFFLHMATNVIHGPEHAANIVDLDPTLCYGGRLREDPTPAHGTGRQSLLDRLKEAGVPATHRSVGMLWLDDAIGALVRELKESGQYDNTLIVFAADHGVEGKFSTHASGTRVPCLWKLPGSLRAGHRARPHVQNVDFLPTLADLLGLEAGDVPSCDGTSYLPVLEGSQEATREDLYFEFGTQRAVQTRDWKYIAFRYHPEAVEAMRSGQSTALNPAGRTGISRAQKMHPGAWDPDQLYDRLRDPGERMNMAGWDRNRPVLADMKARLRRYTTEMNPAFPDEADPFQHSAQFRELTRAATAVDLCDLPNQPWYAEGWY